MMAYQLSYNNVIKWNKVMELVQIIYDILLWGGALLVFVIIISYVMSKSRIEDEVSYNYADSRTNQKSLMPQRKINYEQIVYRRKAPPTQPHIFPIVDFKPKEVKLIRKPTEYKRESQEEIRIEEKHLTKTNGNGNGNGKRYTIVNDDMNRSKTRAANFYL